MKRYSSDGHTDPLLPQYRRSRGHHLRCLLRQGLAKAPALGVQALEAKVQVRDWAQEQVVPVVVQEALAMGQEERNV